MHTTLEILTHPLLDPVRHGFFTRRGGASSGLFAGLNCGYGSSDQGDIVAINRARVAEAMGVASEALLTVHQTHSAEIAVIRAGDPLPGIGQRKADGIVTDRPGIAIAVLTADCQPILLADAGRRHWRRPCRLERRACGVIEATLGAMADLGARRIRAVIGPTISQRAYEVSPEFMDEFLSDDPGHHRFFAGGPNGRPMFDLPSYGLMRLREAGAEAEWIGRCTYADPERFFSYRRSTHLHEADYGRLISVIRL